MTDRIQLSRSQLPLLFEALQENNEDLRVKPYPSEFDAPLYTSRLSKPTETTVRFRTRRDDYESTLQEIGLEYGQDSTQFSEIPDRREYIASCTTGLIRMSNQNEITDLVEAGRGWGAHAETTVTYVGFDTNLMELRLGNRFQVDPSSTGGIDGYALVTGIRKELEKSSGKRKLDASAIDRLTDSFGDVYRGLRNQKRKRYRTQQLGSEYYRRLNNSIAVERLESDTGDSAIINAYAELANRSATNLIVFTADADFVDQARNRINVKHVEIPEDLPRKSTGVSWNEIATSLYQHAVRFGVLKLSKVDLYGVWPGKKPEAWENDKVVVDPRGDFNFTGERLQRHINLLDAWECVADEK